MGCGSRKKALGWTGRTSDFSACPSGGLRDDRILLRPPVAALPADPGASRLAGAVPVFPASRRRRSRSPAAAARSRRPLPVRPGPAPDVPPEPDRGGPKGKKMIDALSNTYRELAAETMGVPAGKISILMVHRPHEEKDYADQSIYFFFLTGERFPSAVGKVGFDPAGAHYLDRGRRGLQSPGDREKAIPASSGPPPLLFRGVGGRHAPPPSALPGEKGSTWLIPGVRLHRRP